MNGFKLYRKGSVFPIQIGTLEEISNRLNKLLEEEEIIRFLASNVVSIDFKSYEVIGPFKEKVLIHKLIDFNGRQHNLKKVIKSYEECLNERPGDKFYEKELRELKKIYEEIEN
ncbi:MAG: hypothetical protein ACRCW9_05965 [Cetobacterium sp.]